MTTAVTVYQEPQASFPILMDDVESIRQAFEALRLNLGNRKLTIANLQQMKMPTGGSTVWQFPTINGLENRESIECVLVGQGTPRVYWGSKFGEGEKGAPPDCTSPDGLIGHGLYGADGPRGKDGAGGQVRRIVGDCTMCPMNQWPAKGAESRKKPCAELRNLFFMTAGEDQLLPRYVRITPGSLKVIDDFMIQLGSLRIPYFAAVVRLGLTRQQNRNGIPYAQASLSLVGKLAVEEARKMQAIAESIAHLIGDTTVDRSDVESYSTID